MTLKEIVAHLAAAVAAGAAFALAIGGAEAAGFFKEATGVEAPPAVTELASSPRRAADGAVQLTWTEGNDQPGGDGAWR